MALFNRETTKGFYTELGNADDECFYCRKVIEQKRVDKEIDRDEMYAQIKTLRGKLNNVRIVRIQRAGTTICVCPDCMKKIYAEMFPEIEKPTTTSEPAPTKKKGKSNGEN